MDSDDIDGFLAIVRTGNVTTAAIAVNTTQSALSKRVKNLENELGVTLFHRGKGMKSVTLTPTGEKFHEMASRWQGLQREMKDLQKNDQSFSLNVGVLDSIQPLTIRLTRNLLHSNPDIRIRLQNSTSEGLYYEIDKRTVDVAFANKEMNLPSVACQRLFSEPFVCLLPEPRDGRTTSTDMPDRVIPVSDLDPDLETYTRWHSPGYRSWHEHCLPPNRSQRLSVSNVHLQLAFLGIDKRWAIMPFSLAKAVCARYPYHMVRLDPEPPLRICYLLTHQKILDSCRAVIDVFMECLTTTLRTEMPYLTMLMPSRD